MQEFDFFVVEHATIEDCKSFRRTCKRWAVVDGLPTRLLFRDVYLYPHDTSLERCRRITQSIFAKYVCHIILAIPNTYNDKHGKVYLWTMIPTDFWNRCGGSSLGHLDSLTIVRAQQKVHRWFIKNTTYHLPLAQDCITVEEHHTAQTMDHEIAYTLDAINVISQAAPSIRRMTISGLPTTWLHRRGDIQTQWLWQPRTILSWPIISASTYPFSGDLDTTLMLNSTSERRGPSQVSLCSQNWNDFQDLASSYFPSLATIRISHLPKSPYPILHLAVIVDFIQRHDNLTTIQVDASYLKPMEYLRFFDVICGIERLQNFHFGHLHADCSSSKVGKNMHICSQKRHTISSPTSVVEQAVANWLKGQEEERHTISQLWLDTFGLAGECLWLKTWCL